MSDRGYGRGSVYQRASDGRWVATITLDGKRHTLYADSEADGHARLDRILQARGAGRAVVTRSVRVGDYADRWRREILPYARSRKGRPLAPGTIKLYGDAVVKYVIPVIGSRPLDRVNEADVERVLNRMTDLGRSSDYINIVHNAMKRLFRDARKEQLVERLPFDDVVPPAGKPVKDKVVPDRGQVLELIDAAPTPRMRAFVATLAYTGLRISEALSLRWSDYDGAAARLTVLGKGSKTRSVFVSEGLRRELVAWRAEQLRMRAASWWWGEGDWLLSSEAGTRWDGANARRQFRQLTQPICPGATPHSLRHAAATMLLEEGVPMKVVSEVLGHSGIDVTANRYMHVTARLSDEAARAIDRALTV